MAYNYWLENWIEFAVGTFVVLLRLFIRARKYGFRRWQADDYLMMFTLALWVVIAVVRFQISKGTAIVVGPETPPAELYAARLSKKYNFAAWILYVTFLWSLKGCLLILYARILRSLAEHRVVVYTAWLLGLTYIGAILQCFLHCLPLSDKWISYPVPSAKCRSGVLNFLVVGLLNLITDLVLFGIPIRMLMGLRLPMKRKIVIVLVLCSGVLTIAATIIRNVAAYMVTKGNTGNWNQAASQGWALRESFIALVVVNIPCLRPLISSAKWIKTISNSRKGASKAGPSAAGGSGSGSTPTGTNASRHRAFFRRYSSMTLQTWGLTTVEKGDETRFIKEEENEDEKAAHNVNAIVVPAKSYTPPKQSTSSSSNHQNGFLGDLEANGGGGGATHNEQQRYSGQPSEIAVEEIEREMKEQGIHCVLPSPDIVAKK